MTSENSAGMAMDIDPDAVQTVTDIFQNISICDQDDKRKKDLLENLRTAMANFSRNQVAQNVDQFPLETLFNCLGEETEITCVILRDLMAVSDPAKNLAKYHEYMLQGFNHPAPEVRILVLAQLSKCTEAGDPALSDLTQNHPALLVSSLKELVGPDLGVSKEASSFITKLAATSPGFHFLLSPPSIGLDTLKELITSRDSSEAVKFRVYEMLAHISNISKAHLDAIESHLKLTQILGQIAFQSNDPLGQMNALEILAILVESRDGLERLESENVLKQVQALGADWKNEPMSGLLFPGLLKFVGKVGVNRVPPKELVEMVIDAIVDSGDDIPLTTVGVEALAYIGSTPEGKVLLDSDARLGKCFGRVQQVLGNSSSEFRCRVLEALSHLFGSDEANSTFLPRWFALAFPQISVLFDLVQLPFADIRLSALNFLASIAHLEWAQKHYLRSPGVIEFLTDRNAEPDKDCALAKFKIVSIIVDSATPTTLKILSKENMARLRVHLRQGPFYAPAQSSVAYEGSA